MTKIETDFEKLNHYEDIETYYPPLDDIKDFLYELFGDRVESQKYIIRANKKIEQLQSNWNSLREWLENKIDNFQDDVSEPILHEQMTMRVIYEYMENLDKMNELEGKDK